MNSATKAQFIVEQWRVSLSQENLKLSSMSDNFYRLVSALASVKIPLEDAYDVMKSAIRNVAPPSIVVKKVYAKKKREQSLREFEEAWLKKIYDVAMEKFYEFYKIEGVILDGEVPSEKSENEVSPEDEEKALEESFYKNTKLVTRDKPWLFQGDHKDEQR